MDNTGSTDTLYVRYDGPAMRSHEMEVKQLAPALLAMARAFEALQKDVEPDARVSLNVKATREGSFAVDLLVHLANEASDFLNGTPVNSVLNASGLIGIFFGVIKVAKKAANHVTVVTTKEAGTDENGLALVEIAFSDGTRITERAASVEALNNSELVGAVKEAIAPALNDGVDLVQFESGTRSETVNSEEADMISGYDPDKTEHTEDTVQIIVQALDVSFRENGKWRITDGIKTQFVTLEDQDFEKSVLDGTEAMRANDIYRVVMRVDKSLDKQHRLTTKYVSIVKVLEHRGIGDQPTLF